MNYQHPAVVEYIAACKDLIQHLNPNSYENPAKDRRFKIALNELRDYLDDLGKPMPAPRYHYDPKDLDTWKYLNIVITGSKSRGRRYLRAIENPNFKY